MRSSAFITEAYINPAMTFSDSPRDAPFNLAFGTSDPIFDWFERPENKARRVRFGIGMAGTNNMGPKDSVLAGEWTDRRPQKETWLKISSGR
jgi:hypothetical protein